MAQVVEYLTRKHEALSSNYWKKIRKKEGRKEEKKKKKSWVFLKKDLKLIFLESSLHTQNLLCLESMLGISLCSYLYLKLAKARCVFYYLLWFLFNKIGEFGRIGSA
jgi:hypothetical protein